MASENDSARGPAASAEAAADDVAKTTPGMHGAEAMDGERLLAEICKRRQIPVVDLSRDVDDIENKVDRIGRN